MKGQQLGQLRPSDTTAASIYSPDAGEAIKIFEIVVCNTTTNNETFRIFHDEDGTTYDQTTAQFYNAPIAANSTVIIETNWWMRNDSGNLAVRTSTGSALTFTVSGEINQI